MIMRYTPSKPEINRNILTKQKLFHQEQVKSHLRLRYCKSIPSESENMQASISGSI
jgi:hypothetical protein